MKLDQAGNHHAEKSERYILKNGSHAWIWNEKSRLVARDGVVVSLLPPEYNGRAVTLTETELKELYSLVFKETTNAPE